jgi:muramoyltetrapeptide carboxypeptidase LdcA involved in peptidoglycan recycling
VGLAQAAADGNRACLAVTEYQPGVPLVFGVDFGHTQPQHVIPSGGSVTVDGAKREIWVSY